MERQREYFLHTIRILWVSYVSIWKWTTEKKHLEERKINFFPQLCRQRFHYNLMLTHTHILVHSTNVNIVGISFSIENELWLWHITWCDCILCFCSFSFYTFCWRILCVVCLIFVWIFRLMQYCIVGCWSYCLPLFFTSSGFVFCLYLCIWTSTWSTHTKTWA